MDAPLARSTTAVVTPIAGCHRRLFTMVVGAVLAGLVLIAGASPALAAPRTDLRVTKLSSPPGKVTAPGTITVREVTKNLGRARAGRSVTRFYLSSDRRRSADDRRIGTRAISPLSPGRASRGSVRLNVPTVPAGNYRLLACANDSGSVRERNRRNNCRSSRATRIELAALSPVTPQEPLGPGPTAGATLFSAASTSTFGRSTVGSMHVLTADRKRVSRFSLPQPGTPTQISVYVDGRGDGSGSSQTIRLVLYADQSGNPGRLLATTSTHTINRSDAGRWVHLSVSKPPALTAGNYHLGIHSSTSNRLGRYAAVDASGALKQNDDRFSDGATDPFGSTQTFNLGLSIYATYTPGTTADTQAPSAPQNLTFPTKTETAVTQSWSASTDNVGVAGYRVYRNSQLITTTQQTSHNHTGLQCGTSYTFAVEAFDAAGNTSTRTSATTSTQPCPDTTAPSQPGNFAKAGSSETSVSLTWSASTDNIGVAGYRVYRDGSLAGSTTGTSHTVSGLECGKNYAFAVEAHDAAGNTSSRATLTAETDPCAPPADIQAPSVPQGLTMSAKTDSSISLSWNASTDNVGVAGYRLYRNGTVAGTTPNTTYTFTGLTCGTTYTLALEAYDAAGNASNRAEATTIRTTSDCPQVKPPPTSPEPGPTSDGKANLWMSTTGGSCTRSATPLAYDAAKACGTAGAAYSAANASADASLVLIKGGTYGDQTLTGNRTSSQRIVFAPAPGETVRVGRFVLGQMNVTSAGPDRVTVRGVTATEYGGSAKHAPNNKRNVVVLQGSNNIVIENTHFGSMYVGGAKDLIVRDNKFGPCWAGNGMTGDPFTQTCGNFKIDGGWEGTKTERRPERILIEDNEFYDFRMGPSCFTTANGGTHSGSPSSPDCHYECVFLNGGADITFRGNAFRDCALMNIFTEDTQGYGYSNLVIENNSFGTPISYGAGTGRYDTPSYSRPDALAIGCKTGHPGYTNLLIRNNSFARNTGMDIGFGGCVTASGIQITGNIMQRPPCSPRASFGWNVYNASGATGTCAASDINIGGTRFPFYANDTLTPTGHTDFKLAGTTATPDDLIPATACPTKDAFHHARAANGRCDAGIHER